MTKFAAPVLRDGHVSRPQLVERLAAGARGTLTLVSGAAGTGKTALLAEWGATVTSPVAWLSTDGGDADPARWLRAVAAALRRADPAFGVGLERLLDAPASPADALRAAVLHAVSAIADETVLVVDDLQLAPTLGSELEQVLAVAPPAFHLVLVTRADPPIPLGRLRASGALTEIRTEELRFTEEEAQAFFSASLLEGVASARWRDLYHRCEGWIAGMHLAAASVRQAPDPAAAIAAVTRSTGAIGDYLVEEVIDRQPPDMRAFLEATSIVDRVCPSLCDAITGGEDAGDRLLAMQRENLFLLAIDREQREFRYHHLLAEALRRRLGTWPAADRSRLHQRASVWYEEHGDQLGAFRHAAEAGDVDRAGRLLEAGGRPLYVRGMVAVAREWLSSLPESAFVGRPTLRVAHAMVLVVSGAPPEQVTPVLRRAAAEVDLEPDGPGTGDMRGQLAAIRAMLAIPRGDGAAVVSAAREALERLDARNAPVRLSAQWALGHGLQLVGDGAAARTAFGAVIRTAREEGNLLMEIAAATTLGQLAESDAQGERARFHFLRAVELAGDPPLPFACEAYLGLARLALANGDPEAAVRRAEEAGRLGERIANVDTPARAAVVAARGHLTAGNPDRAEASLEVAEELLRRRGFPDVLPEVAAVRVAVYRSQGRMTAARSLAAEFDIADVEGGAAAAAPAEPLSPRELEVLTLISQGLSNREICDRLFLALDTVKGHNRRIFEKLGVRRRTEAVARARELGVV